MVEDPCEVLMNTYLTCVKGKNRGLSEGDECEKEAVRYKSCRREQKKSKNNKNLNADASEDESTFGG